MYLIVVDEYAKICERKYKLIIVMLCTGYIIPSESYLLRLFSVIKKLHNFSRTS